MAKASTAAPKETAEEQAVVDWQRVPTIVVDGVLGTATVGGLYRIVLGEFVLNPTAGATKPMARPVVSMTITAAALRGLVDSFNAILGPVGDGE